MTSLIIPFRYSSGDSFDLRYALRSWDKHGVDIEDAYIVGSDVPAWYFGGKIAHQHDHKMSGVSNVLHKIKLACEDERVTDPFIYTNDDVYMLAPLPDQRFHMKYSPYRESGIHHKGWIITIEELKKRKIPHLVDAELHIPIRYNKQKALALLNSIDIKQPYSFRTLYCNVYREPSEPLKDVKYSAWKNSEPESWCYSSGNDTMNSKQFLDWIKRKFSLPSRWEG